MEWKLSGEVKPEYDDHVFFEERVNHSCFSLKRTPSSFYIFGGSSKYTKYNDVVQFKKHENPQHDNMEWTYSIVSKGNSYEGKKSSMFGLFGLGKSNNNLSTSGPQYPSLREGHTTIVWETEVLKVNPVTKAEEYVMEEQVILFGGYNGSNYLNDVWVLDTTEWKWTRCDIDEKQSRPSGRSMHTAMVYNDCMWVFGGYSGSEPLADFWCLDLETKIWTQVAFDRTKAPEARYGHSGVIMDMSLVFEAQAKKLYIEMMKSDIDKNEIKMPIIEKNQHHMVIMFGFSNLHAMYIGKITEALNTKNIGGTCFNDVWSFSFTTSKWHCLTDPSKSIYDDKDKNIITKVVDVTKGVTNATVSQVKGFGKQLGISGKTAWSEIARFTPFYSYSSTTSYGSVATTLDQPPDERYSSAAVNIGRGCILIFGGVRDYTHRRDCHILDLVNESFVPLPRMIKLNDSWPTARKGHVMIYDSNDDCVYVNGGSNFKQGIQAGVATVDVKQVVDLLKVGVGDLNISEEDDVVVKAENELKSTEKHLYEDVKIDKTQEEKNQLVKVIEAETIKIRKNPRNIEQYRTRADCYMKLKMWDKANLDVDEGLKIKPDDSDFKTKKGIIYYRLNDHISARLMLTDVISDEESKLVKGKFPNNLILRSYKIRAKCRIKERNFNEAINDANRFLKYVEMLDMIDVKEKKTVDYASIGSWMTSVYIVKATAFERKKQYDTGLTTIDSSKEQIQQFFKKASKAANFSFSNILSFKNEKPQDVYLREKLEKFERFLSEKRDRSLIVESLFEKAKNLLESYREKINKIDEIRMKEQEEIVEEESQTLDLFFEEYLFKEIDENMEQSDCDQAIDLLKKVISFEPFGVKYIISLADAFYLKADYKQCVKYAKKVLEMAVDYWKAYFIIGSCYLSKRKVAKAIDFFAQGVENCEVVNAADEFLEMDGISVNEGFNQLKQALKDAEKKKETMQKAANLSIYAKQLFQQGNYEDALLTINEVIEKDPTNISYLSDKVDILLGKKKHLNALKVAVLASRISPKSYEGYLCQGVALQFLNRYHHSITVLEAAMRMFPENSNIKSQLMKSKDLYKKKQLAQMKYERALFIFQDVEKEIITENPKFTLYKINITSLEPSQKIITQIEQIVTLLDEAIDLYPHSADFYLSKARCKYLLRQYIHCVTHIKEAIEVMRQITDGLYLSFLSQRYKKADTDDEKKEDTVDRVNVDVIYEAISLGARAYTSMRQFDIATNYLKDMTFKHRAQKKKKIEDYERHLYLQSDHIGKLEDLTKKVEDLKRTRDKFDFLVKAGMNSKTKNDYYGAIRQFTEALALKVEDSEEKTQDDRDYASIYFERAECYYENQEFEKSIEDCRQAVKLESTFPHFYVLLCKALMESGNLEESIELCNSALAQSPFNTPLNDVWHNVKLQTASFEAERKFEEGKEAIEAGEFDVAISCLNKAIRLRPNNIEYLLARSRALFERQKFKKAIEDSGKVLKFDPKNIIAIRLHSDIHLELKNFSEAKTLLQKGMDMYPKDQTLRSRLEKLIRIESQWNEAYLRARDAEDCYANGNYEQALELYSSAIQLHSDCSQYLCRRARVLLKLSQPEIALKDAQEALLHDTSEEVYATLATIYLELCDYEKAKEVIEESLEFDDEENMDNLLLLKDEIYDRESKSVTAAEKDEEGQMFFENYTAFMKRKKEEIKQEIKDSKEEEDEGLYTSIFSALSIFSYGAKKKPIEIEEEDDSYEDLKKAQELFSEAVLLEPNNKRYLRHHVESLMLDKDPDRHEEALNQSATMIKMFPNYTDGFCTAAKLHAEKFRNTYESLFLSVMGLEHDRERQGLSVQILRTVLNIVDNYEIPIMKNSKTLRKLGKVQDKSEMAFDSAQAFEELEGHEIMDNVIGTINTPATKNKKESDQDVNVPSLSLDELLDGEDFEDLLKNTQDEATSPAVPVGKNRKSVKVFKISNRKEQVEFTKKLYEMDRQNNIMKDPFSNVRAVLTGFSRASVTILKSQREEAFNLAARAVFVMYFDVNIGMPSEKFNTLFNIVSEACFVGDDLKDYKLRELKKFGVKNLLLEECTTRYHRFVDSEDEHPFYSKKYFESDREYENFIETETKNIDEALSQFNLSLDDVKKRHDNGDEDVRYRHVIIQQFIDCILQYSLFTVEEKRSSSSLDSDDEDEKDEKLTKVKTKMLTLKDESLEVIQAVSNFYGYGDGVFAFLVLLEKLSRQFKHSYSEIGNIYKCLLHLVRTIITRNLSAAGKLKKKDKLLDDDPVIDRYYLTTSEKRIFSQAAKNINRELSFIVDNHWKSANETMDTIIMFAIKVSTLIHAFSCMADPDGINHGYKSLSIATKEGIENSMVNLFDYYRGKIITKLEEKDPNLQPDESGGLHPVQLLCLIEVLNEHLPRYETHFEPTFPSSVGVMKVVCNQVYSCIEIELHKLKSSKFRYYTERGELPLGLFDLPSKIEKIYQLLADHANVQPYALKDIFIPYVYKWIETFEKSATSWCKKAVDYGEWKPITPDVSYTTSVIDTFTSLRQSLIILEASLQFLKSEIQPPAQYASESILDSFRTLAESTNSKFGTGNSTLETLPLIYVTYTHVIATVIENYANMNLEIFVDNTMKMKKIEEEYVSRKTSAKYKDMLLKRKTTAQQQQQEEDLYEETRKDVHKQIVSKMGLCMNNILETINQVRSLSEDIHKQLLKQQSEIANQIEEYDLGSLDEDDESQSIDLSTSMGSSSYSQKKKDDLLEGMRMMHDTMKVLLSSLKGMIQEKMNNHLSQLIFKTMKESLIDTITKISQPGAVPSSPGTPTRSIPSTPTRTASSNRLPTNNLQPVVSEIDLNSLMTPLFDYLDDQLATLYSVLNDRVFEVVLRNIFNMLIDELKECAIPPADRPTLSRSQIEKFKTTFESFMDYFNANGSGLDVKYIKEHFDFISELFQLSLTSTKKLVDEYNEKSVQIEDVANLIETMNKDLARKDDGEDIHDLKDQISDAEEVKSKIIVTSNYIFAILHRRAIETRNKRMNDPDATKFVTSEMSLFEGNQAIINTDYDTFQRALKNAKDNYQQSKQSLDNLKKEIDGLKKKYKHVKSMRVITNERKQTRAKAKELRKEIENLYHQKAILELEKKNITEMVQNEAKMIESEFFDMESSDYLKDIVFRLDAFVRSCRKGLAGQLGEEFMNFLKFPTKITGAEEDVKLVITDFFRCMYRGNDGFICILSSPDICISWIPISSLIKLFKLDVTIEATAKEYSMLHYLNPMTAIRGTASFFTSEPQYNTQIDYIKISIGKIKSVFRSTFGAGALDNSITVSKSEKEFQFSCFKDREKAFEVIQTFILKNASEFKAKDSSLVNKLLFINTTKEDDKDSDIASQQKIISKKGYPVSDVVRRTFNLKPETRLFNKYSCTDYDTKLIGEFYIFTDCLCFTTTVNSGACLKMVLPYSQLLKISKVGKKNMNNRQCIQLTNEKRVSYSFVNFKNVEEVFQETIETIKKCCPEVNIVLKAENSIAFLVHPTVEANNGLLNMGKYSKFFKL